MDSSEIIDISSINLGGESGGRSSNFGGGLELLMNDKKSSGGRPSSDINIDDLNNLENELNDLVDDVDAGPSLLKENLTCLVREFH
jgi:hypothetical protein